MYLMPSSDNDLMAADKRVSAVFTAIILFAVAFFVSGYVRDVAIVDMKFTHHILTLYKCLNVATKHA
jgi:hypothetical protein